MKYEIIGETLPVVVCHLEKGEKVINETGAMSWMSPNMKMETTSNGGAKKVFGRSVSGEGMFQNVYTSEGGPGMIAFSSCFPGSIIAFEVGPGREFLLQRSAFLAGEEGIELSVYIQKKAGVGIFGEGFIMQKVSGQGVVFAEIDGHVVEYELREGEQILVDTGHLAAMSTTCGIDIQKVEGVKNKMFGGEGFFNTLITGPGHIWLQTMPIRNVADALKPYLPTQSSSSPN